MEDNRSIAKKKRAQPLMFMQHREEIEETIKISEKLFTLLED